MALLWKFLFNILILTEVILLTFTNNIHTYEGGTHETGFKMALTRVINDYGHKSGVLKGNETLSGDECT